MNNHERFAHKVADLLIPKLTGMKDPAELRKSRNMIVNAVLKQETDELLETLTDDQLDEMSVMFVRAWEANIVAGGV